MAANGLLRGGGSTSHPVLTTFGLNRYVSDTEPAWLATAGAMEWLQRLLADPNAWHHRELVDVSVPHGDQSRWKRWEGMFERAQHFLMNDQASEAKKLCKSALREAERIDYTAAPFHNTMTSLLELAVESGESFTDLRKRIEERAARLSASSLATEPIYALHCQSFGILFQFMDDPAAAARYHQIALTEMDRHIADGHQMLTLCDSDEARYELACCLFELERYADAVPILVRAIELLDSYVGPQHVRLLEVLDLAYKCMSHAGDEDGASRMRERLTSIDELYFDVASMPDGTVCGVCSLDHD